MQQGKYPFLLEVIYQFQIIWSLSDLLVKRKNRYRFYLCHVGLNPALLEPVLFNFLSPLVNGETNELTIDWEDEIIKGTLVSKDGKLVHPVLTGEGG